MMFLPMVAMPRFVIINIQFNFNAAQHFKNERAIFKSCCETTPTHFVVTFLRFIQFQNKLKIVVTYL